MSLKSFFENTLHAKLNNHHTSWGAVDAMDRVFLRVFKDKTETTSDGKRIEVAIESPNPSLGYKERQRHIALIEGGARAYGVLCTPSKPTLKKPYGIKHFDQVALLQLGKLTKDGDKTFARIDGRIPVEQVINQTKLSEDLDEINARVVEPTTKLALINARISQGKFRTQVLNLWNNRCAVTSSLTKDAIKASHILPWRESTDQERLDPNNGLPLIANLDALFDAYLISFDETGKLLVSSHLSSSERQLFQIDAAALTKQPSPETETYLTRHRDKFNDKSNSVKK